MDFKSGLRDKPGLIKVYEKISRGIWSYKGFFELIDANIVSDGKRKVFKFSLKPVEEKSFGRVVELPHNRLIPTAVKVEVWRRDSGQCVQCGSTKNLHFDHDIHFRKAAAVSRPRTSGCSAPSTTSRNQTRSWRSPLGFSPERPRSARSRSSPDDCRRQGGTSEQPIEC
jgi:hypothetical protein